MKDAANPGHSTSTHIKAFVLLFVQALGCLKAVGGCRWELPSVAKRPVSGFSGTGARSF